MFIDQSCKLIKMDQRKTSLNSGHFRVIENALIGRMWKRMLGYRQKV